MGDVRSSSKRLEYVMVDESYYNGVPFWDKKEGIF